MAESSMIPSMPRLITPDRSAKSSPGVPKISGVAMRMRAAKKPIWNSWARRSYMAGSRQAQPILGEEQGCQHAEQRDALDDIGEKDRHAGRPRHPLRPSDDHGEEYRGRQYTHGAQPGPHGHHDAEI